MQCSCLFLVFQAFYQEGALITNPRLIWQHYLRKDFLIDIISIMPIDWILIMAQQYTAAVFLRLLRLIQLFVVATYLSDLETSPGVNVTAVRLAKVFFIYILLSHLVGCAWFSFALPNNFGLRHPDFGNDIAAACAFGIADPRHFARNCREIGRERQPPARLIGRRRD